MLCEEKLTVKECFDTLLTMSNGKSPGNDGLTKEFYVCFWEDLDSLLVDTLNYAFQYSELSTSQRQAVITLIEKKGRDKRLIKNWRPISLINVDTKIASKNLAMRIKEFLPQLVDRGQTAYVKGRNIGESIRLTDDLLEYADKENLDGLIFAADTEKAFDSIEHNFLPATLTRYGFGSNFIQWIKTLLSNCESCVMNNGLSTGYFKLSRGTKQGDPLSPYLFILVLEILFIQVRNDPSVQGFKIGEIEIKLSAFADDTTFFVRNKESINRLLNIMRKFGEFSSLHANVEKCEACWIGR